ncbi:CotS family spore coat protein [Caloramator sp. CAR-1]|jgi:CotS family spore coat protein|uniref:CotS family spore coat protein n=2 Tax=Caloramator TaxID=44258 RepID=UPI0026E31ACF|nr:CotS family spore coat protein [Caloramator sp. CAR-1]MDO6354461.1 CotS family spore coat protein [Caloramator sp. CAR-1]
MENISSVERAIYEKDIIINKILSNYNIEVYSIENIKIKETDKERAVYKIATNKGDKCLKKVYYDEKTLLFIYSVIEWLNIKGILAPRFISTKKGLKYVNYQGNLFILTDWIDGRKCDYDNIDDIKKISENLAKLHKSSKGFFPIEGSKLLINDKDYFKSYNKHFKQLIECANLAYKIKDKFSKIFLDSFDYYLNCARESLYILSSLDFNNLGDEISNGAICHLDYVNKNLIFTPDDKVYVIDFDKTRIDCPVHDISSFLHRILKRKKTAWDFSIFETAINNYQNVRKLNKNEMIAIYAFLLFPKKLWKVSKDYYKNIKYCNKGQYIDELKSVVKYRQNHQEFSLKVEEFIEKNFRG